MTPEYIEQLGNSLDEGFFLIGLAILAIEAVKGLFSKSFRWRGFADMFASISTQIPFLLIEIFILSFAYLGFIVLAETYITWTFQINLWTVILAVLVAECQISNPRWKNWQAGKSNL